MKGSMCAAHVLCLVLLAGSPALAFRGAGFSGGMHFGGFGGGMQFGGGRFGTASGFHGGFGPAFHGPGFVGRSFVTNPGVFHGGFDHFHGGFGHFPVHPGFGFHHAFPHQATFFFGFGHPFFFPSSRIVIVSQPFFFPPFGIFVSAPFFCFPCGISFSTETIFFDHIHRFHHFHGVPPHLHVAAGSRAVFVGA
jgi:hypothetical protein